MKVVDTITSIQKKNLWNFGFGSDHPLSIFGRKSSSLGLKLSPTKSNQKQHAL